MNISEKKKTKTRNSKNKFKFKLISKYLLFLNNIILFILLLRIILNIESCIKILTKYNKILHNFKSNF